MSQGYNETFLPNARDHTTQSEASMEMGDFSPLLSTGCSNALSLFLCFYYLPTCTTIQLPGSSAPEPISFKPCRNLCEHVRARCEADLTALLSQAGQPSNWPAHFECTLDDFGDPPQCLGPSDPSSLENDFTTTGEPIGPTTAGPTSQETEELTTDSQTTVGLGTGGERVTQPSLCLTLLVVLSVLTVISFLR